MTSHREGGATSHPDTALVRRASNALQVHPTFGNLFSGEPDAFDDMARVALEPVLAVLRGDIEQIKREAGDEPYVEPDRLDDLLGLDPNDLSDRLAAHAVEYRNQRDDLARQVEGVRHILSSGYGSLIAAQADLRAAVGLPIEEDA